MIDSGIRSELGELCKGRGGCVFFDHPLSENSTIGIGGRAAVWYEPSSFEELCEAKVVLEDRGAEVMVVGDGSNVLFPDDGMDAVMIRLSAAPFKKIEFDGGTVRVGAGASLARLVSECCKKSLAGFEGLAGVPGTLGGALTGNAGNSDDISGHLDKVRVLNSGGGMEWLDKNEVSFGYRSSGFDKKSIILEAVFLLDEGNAEDLNKKVRKLILEKSEHQPLGEKTLGCVFKNPVDGEATSGQLIDRCGMKGYRIGGAVVSEKHANFIVNDSGATSGDVTALMGRLKRKVHEKFSIELEPEIKIL